MYVSIRIIIFVSLLIFPSIANATTRYVRPDGGTAAQCTGTTDAAYPGSGLAQACAHKHPFYTIGWYAGGNEASPTGGQAGTLVGGDTLIIARGSYQMGNDSNTTGMFTNCGANTTTCKSRPIPSGSDVDHPTKVLGCSVTGCTGAKSTYPELWGSGRVEHVLSLKSSSYVQVGWLNITDHATCGFGHFIYGCGSADINELSATDGILIRFGTGLILQNLWVHGLYRYGLYGGNVNGMRVIDSNIDVNSYGGWNGDSCDSSTCGQSGVIYFSGSTSPTSTSAVASIDYNGCVENASTPGIPATQGCYGQNQSGYGDGLGTNSSIGTWIFEQVDVSHNTSDGIDLLYVNKDGLTSGTLSVKKSRIEGNAGNQVKGPNAMTLEDNVIVGNCAFFNTNSIKQQGSPPNDFSNCRAEGNTIVIAWRNNSSDTPKIYNNTITTNGTGAIIIEGPNSSNCTAGTNILLKNNTILGGRRWGDDTANNSSGGNSSINLYYNSAAADYGKACVPTVVSDYNVCSGDFNGGKTCATSVSSPHTVSAGSNNSYVSSPTNVYTGTIQQGPTTYYSGTNYIDQLTIKSTSTAINRSDTTISGTDSLDFNAFNRGSSWDAGALEFGTTGGGPSPTCGDGSVVAPEICDSTNVTDPSGVTHTCASEGFTSGTLTCNGSCNGYNTSSCVTSLCGDSNIDSGEQCDTANIGTATCSSLGYSGSGIPGCNASCQLTQGTCTNSVPQVCGDGIQQAGEECDPPPGNIINGDGCSSRCESEIPPYELFLTYTDGDSASYIDTHTNYAQVSGMTRTANAYLRKDFGASYFTGDFTHDFTVKIDSCTDDGSGHGGILGVWGMSTTARTSIKDMTNNTDGAALYMYCLSSSSQYLWTFIVNGSAVTTEYNDPTPVNIRYIRVARVSGALTAKIYSDAAHTNLLATLTPAADSHAYRYFYAPLSYNTGTTNTLASGKVSNYNLTAGTSTPPPPSSSGTKFVGCTCTGCQIQ